MIDYRDRNNELQRRRTPLQQLAGFVGEVNRYNIPDPVALNPAMYAVGAATPPPGGVEQLRRQGSDASFGARAQRPASRSNIDPLAYGMSGNPYDDQPAPQAAPAAPTGLTPQERAEMAVRYRQANQRAADAAKAGDRFGASEYRTERDILGRAALAASTGANLARSRDLPMSQRTIKLDGSYDNAEMYGGATPPNQEAIAQRMLETGMAYRGQLAEADRIAKLRSERIAFDDGMTGAARDAALSTVLTEGKMARAGGRTADMVGDYASTEARNADLAAKTAKAKLGKAESDLDAASLPTPDEARAALLKRMNEAKTVEEMAKSGLATPEDQAEFVQGFIDSMTAAGSAWMDDNDTNTKARTRMAGMIATLEDLAEQDPAIAKQLARQVANQLPAADDWPLDIGPLGTALEFGPYALQFGPYALLPKEYRKYVPTLGNVVRAFDPGSRSRQSQADVRKRLLSIAGIK